MVRHDAGQPHHRELAHVVSYVCADCNHRTEYPAFIIDRHEPTKEDRAAL
jgi:hypothetical protein